MKPNLDTAADNVMLIRMGSKLPSVLIELTYNIFTKPGNMICKAPSIVVCGDVCGYYR